MKISALACVLICFLAVPQSTKSQAFKGLQRIHIVVEDLTKVDEGMGLDSEAVKNQILVALKRDIPKLKIVESPGTSFVHLKITSTPVGTSTETYGVAAFVQVSLFRPAQIVADDGTRYFTIVTAWRKGALLTSSVEHMAAYIRDTISEAMTELAAAYYKDNP